jgi:hypothetical protein
MTEKDSLTLTAQSKECTAKLFVRRGQLEKIMWTIFLGIGKKYQYFFPRKQNDRPSGNLGCLFGGRNFLLQPHEN